MHDGSRVCLLVVYDVLFVAKYCARVALACRSNCTGCFLRYASDHVLRAAAFVFVALACSRIVLDAAAVEVLCPIARGK